MGAISAARDAERSPALFLEFRPAIWTEGSLRVRFTGRAEGGFVPFGVADVGGGCFALGGGFFADMDGEGDDLDELTPFVWIPGGIGRLIFGVGAP
jgi:hypothetical protein